LAASSPPMLAPRTTARSPSCGMAKLLSTPESKSDVRHRWPNHHPEGTNRPTAISQNWPIKAPLACRHCDDWTFSTYFGASPGEVETEINNRFVRVVVDE